MLIVLSPAKTLDYSAFEGHNAASRPAMQDDAEVLQRELRKLSSSQLKSLLGVSDALAKLNHDRYQAVQPEEKEAIFAFDGDAYKGLKARQLTGKEVAFAQKHLRILCGLYGILKPLDLIRPYRLEMSTKLATADCKDLYAYWRAKITASLARDLAESSAEERYIVNLASQEYFKSIDRKGLGFPIYTMAFPGPALFAKSARGAMTRFIIQNEVKVPEGLKSFTGNDGEWSFHSSRSTEFEYVFERDVKQGPVSKATKEAAKGGRQGIRTQAKVKSAAQTRAAKTEAASMPRNQAANKKRRKQKSD